MAEDNNEDLSMEDILSSIKNILAEGDASTPQIEPVLEPPAEKTPVAGIQETVAEPIVAVADVVAETTEEDDDILDLSPDMRVEDIITSTNDINLDEELDNVSSVSTDLPINEPAIGIPDEKSDPFDSFEDISAPRLPDIDIALLPEQAQVVEQEVVVHDEEPTFVAEETPVVVSTEDVFEDVQQPDQNDSNAIDASASIISNFAKMFAKEDKQALQAPVVETVTEPIKEMGNVSRTLENMIHDVIRNIIGNEVSANWKNGLNYDQLAKEEISRQTRLWLETNLPAIVEKTVKEEIERVMAKVGTYQ